MKEVPIISKSIEASFNERDTLNVISSILQNWWVLEVPSKE